MRFLTFSFLFFLSLGIALGQSSVNRNATGTTTTYTRQTPTNATGTYTAPKINTTQTPNTSGVSVPANGGAKVTTVHTASRRGQVPKTDYFDDVRYTHAIAAQPKGENHPVGPVDPGAEAANSKTADTLAGSKTEHVNIVLKSNEKCVNAEGKTCSPGEFCVQCCICDNLHESLELLEKYEAKFHERGFIYRDFLLGNQKYRVILGRFSKLQLAIRLYDKVKIYFPQSYIIRFN